MMNKPKETEKALLLMKISLGVAALSLLISGSQLADILGVSKWQVLLQNIFSLTLLWFFIYKLEQRRNWARITILVMYALSFITSFFQFEQTMALIEYGTAFLISFILGMGVTIMQIIAIVLLFQKPSSDWFKEGK